MMPTFVHSFMISQIFGLYMIIMAIIMFSRMEHFRAIFAKAAPDNIAFYFFGCIGLLLGIFLVDIHNIWVWKPRLLVTLIGWVVLIKSILWLGFTKNMLNFSRRILAGSGYYVSILIIAVWGIFLLARGTFLDFYGQVLRLIS